MAKKKAEEKVKEQAVVEETVNNVEEQEVKTIDQMTSLELKEYYANEAKAFEEKVSSIQDSEQLNELEKEIFAEYDAADKTIKEKRYALPDHVIFNTRKLFRPEIGFMIRSFFEKMEVEYSHTLGLWELNKLWGSSPKELKFGEYDSTLRILGSLKFKGNKEWENILTISEFFKQCNEEYIKDSCVYDYIASKHQAIMKQRELSAGHTEQADILEGLTPESVNA